MEGLEEGWMEQQQQPVDPHVELLLSTIEKVPAESERSNEGYDGDEHRKRVAGSQ
jgi:hypothetical protein